MPDETRAPSLDHLATLAQTALQSIPEPLRSLTVDVPIRIDDFPDDETVAEMGLDSPFDLLGLYHGVSLDQKSVSASADDVDMVFLYRRPILDYWCETGEDLYHIVRHVLIHEIGHHFGFSDEDMDRIERES